MTRPLFSAFVGRLLALTVAAMTLLGLASHAAATRPDPFQVTLHFRCEDPAHPELGTHPCSAAIPAQ